MIETIREQLVSFAISGAVLTALPAGAALAQDGAGEPGMIVVTAQKRNQSIQDVPLSVSVLDAGKLASRGIQSMGDLATAVPGTQLGQGSGVLVPYLRGVGTSATAVGNEASAAVYVDGVYFARLPIGFFSLNNIQRVEVLKGPQGTLFGRNSSAGVIHIITENPSEDTAVRGSIGYGRFDTVQGDLYATTGIGEGLAANISITGRYQGDGYGINPITGNRSAYHDEFAARTKWLAQPSDSLDLTFTAFYARSQYSLEGNTYPGTRHGYLTEPYGEPQPLGYYDILSEFDPKVILDGWGLSLQADQDLPFGKLTSITAYSHEKERMFTEGDFTERPDYKVFLGSRVKQFTQELQLSSLPSDRFNWLVGLYYIDIFSIYDRAEFRAPILYGPDGLDSFAEQSARSVAGFGQASYSPIPALTFTGGLRYTWDKIKGSGRLEIPGNPPTPYFEPAPDSNVTKKLTFKAAVDYKFSSDLMIFGSFSRGYKSGAYNLLVYNPVPTKPEELDAYEVGLKGTVGRLLRFSASVFHYDIKNPQVQLADAGSVLLSNAEKARVRGGELELDANLSDSFTARASLTYLDAKYVRYEGAPSGPPNPDIPFGTLPLISIDASGNRMPQAPKLTFNVGADYRLALPTGSVLLSVDYYYNDGSYWEPDNFLRQKRYGNLSAQLRYDVNDHVNVRLWGKNLTNEKIAAYAYTQAGPSGYPFAPLAPLTWGVALGFSF